MGEESRNRRATHLRNMPFAALRPSWIASDGDGGEGDVDEAVANERFGNVEVIARVTSEK